MEGQPHVQMSGERSSLYDLDLPLMSVRIEVLDELSSIIKNATGFFIINNDSVFLITNWHVVTGYNYPNITTIASPKPRKLRIMHKNVLSRNDGHTSIGDTISLECELYEGTRPLWYQQAPNPEFEQKDAEKLQVPWNIDVVAIPIPLEKKYKRFICLSKLDVTNRIPELGERVVIVGYPHGYSALQSTPEPLVVTRHLAAKVVDRPFTILADGIGARGMSGSPVYSANAQHFYLIGIYKGAVIADDRIHNERIHDFYASLGEIERASSAFSFIDELTNF